MKRLLRLSWQFKWRSLHVLVTQFMLLALTLGGLGLTGLGIDYLRHVLMEGPVPKWPFNLSPPTQWTPLQVMMAVAGGVGLVALVRAVLDYIYQMSVSRLVHIDIVLHLRALVYEKLQKLSFRFFDKNASGTLINRVTSDVQSMRMFIDQVVIQVFIMILSLGVYLAYMLSLHVKLTVACLLTTPLLWVITASFSKRLRPAYLENRRLMDDLVLSFSESLYGMQTIKGFSLERQQADSFARRNNEVLDQRQEIFWLVSFLSPIVGFLTQFNLFVLMAYGGWLVIEGELPLGAGMVVFAGLLQQFSSQISNIGTIADSVQQALAGARRVFEVLDTPPEIEDKPDAKRLERVRGEVAFERVHFSFAEEQSKPEALSDITFVAKPGEVVAVAGATGAGKSALMSLIPRFYDPTSGRVLLDGHDLRDLSVEQVRQSIGIVFQENFLFSNTITKNIAFGAPSATQEQIEKAAKIACAHDFIMEMPRGYETVLTESGANLSGGQRQRLAIARAVLLQPPILLLDDPTAAIDPETEGEILEAIERAIAGRTTFIVAHRLSTLRRADKVIVLERGRIVQMGEHDELMQQEGLYQRAVNLQAVDPESMRALQMAKNREARR